MATKDVTLRLVIQSSKDKVDADLNALLKSLGTLGTTVDQLSQKLSKFGDASVQALEKSVSQAEKLNTKLNKVASDMGAMGLTLAGIGASLGLPFAAGIKAAADFENQMNKVRAVTNFSPDTKIAQSEFQQLTDKARELGKTTTFSATQAAAGIENFGRAGYTTAQSLAAIGPALNLAFVENKDLGSTTEGLVNILSALGLEANQMTRATDVLAKTADSTTSSMGSLTEAMSYAAPVGKSLGMEIELISAFLGRLEQNGIKAERAGTGFRRVMEDLTKPTTEAQATLNSMGVQVVKNAKGNIDAVATFDALAKANLNFGQAAAIFGTQGATVALAITKDIEKIKELAHENENASGALQKQVDIMNSGLTPSLTRLGNAASDVSIQFGTPFLTPLKAVVDAISAVMNKVVEFGKAFPGLSAVVTGIAGFFTMLIVAAGAVSLTIAAVAFAITSMLSGWRSLLALRGETASFFTQKIAYLRQETAAILENTTAIRTNMAAENQRKINAATNAKNFGPGDMPILTGRTGSGSPLRPQFTMPGGNIGMNAIGGAFGAIGGLSMISQAESGVGKIAGGLTAISSILMFIPNPIAQAVGLIGMIGGSVISLIASLTGVRDKFEDISNAARDFSALMADFVKRGDSVETFADAYKRAYGKELPEELQKAFGLVQQLNSASNADTVDKQQALVEATALTYAQMGKKAEEFAKFYQDVVGKPINELTKGLYDRIQKAMSVGVVPQTAGALKNDPYEDLAEKRKSAVADLEKYNDRLATLQDELAQEIARPAGPEEGADRMEAIKQLEEMVKLIKDQMDATKQNITLITEEANARNKAKESLVKAQQDLAKGFISTDVFTEAAKGSNTLEGKLKETENLLSTMTKAADAFYSSLRTADEITLGNIKNEITSLYDSEALRSAALSKAESTGTVQRMAILRQEYAEKKSLRDQEFAAVSAAIDAELARETDAAKRDAILKQRTDKQKAFNESSLAAEKALQDAIAGEVKKQQEVIRGIYDQRRKLEQEMREEVLAGQRTQQEIRGKAADEQARLASQYASAVADLERANSLMATMPEKAIELAKKAREEFKGMSLDLNAMAKDLKTTFQENQELLRELGKKGMSPSAAWVSDLDHVKKQLAEAEDLLKQGKFKEAAELAGQARRPAMGLEKAPEGSGFTDEQTRRVAQTYLESAIQIQEAAQKGGLEFGQQFQKQLEEKAGQATVTIKTAQEALLDANTKQLAIHGDLLRELTSALQGAQSGQTATGLPPGAVASGIAGAAGAQTSAFGGTAAGGQLPLAEGAAARLGGAYVPMAQTAGAGTGSTLTPQEQALIGDTQALLAETDKILAQSASQSQMLAEKEKALGYLEKQGGRLDQGTTPGMDAQWVKDIQSVLSRATPEVMQGYAGKVGDALTSLLGQLQPGSKWADTGVSAMRSAGDMIKDVFTDASATFNEALDEAVKSSFDKGFRVEIIVKNDRGATLGTVARVV